VLTGRGADLIVIDDPLKPEEALSQAQRQAANEWYDHTLYSRLNDKLTGAIVLIMHRLHEEFDRVVRSWDTANKATELSDFSVCTSWGITGKDLYLLHVLRKRMEYPELKRAVLEQAEAFNANVVLIEDKASGTQLIQELVELGLHAVTRYQPHPTRSCACTPRPR
jgi:phage terminase large subunit-like protein